MDHIDPILLSAFVDDEVSADERQLIERHLAACADCRTELEALTHTAALLRRLPQVPLPRPFYVTEAMVAPARRSQESWLRRLMPRLAPLGAVAALLLVVVLVGSQFLAGSPSMAPTTDSASSESAEPALAATDATEEPIAERSAAFAAPTEATTDSAADATMMEEAATEEPMLEPTEAAEEPSLPEATMEALTDTTDTPENPGGGAAPALTEVSAPVPAPQPTTVGDNEADTQSAEAPVEVLPPEPTAVAVGGAGPKQDEADAPQATAQSESEGRSPLLMVAAVLLVLSLLFALLQLLLNRRRR